MRQWQMLSVVLLLAIVITGCGAQQALSGTYVAEDLKQTGETMTETVVFAKDEVTMRAGLVEQTVKYKLEEDQLVLCTDYGEFSYDFSQDENSIHIDGVKYIKKG